MLDVIRPGFAALREATDVGDLAARAAWTVRRLTGLDRVAFCRFDAAGDSEVIAEDKGNADEPSGGWLPAGAGASLCLPITVAGKPWGMMLGHHRQPRVVPPAERAMAEAVADTVSLGVRALEVTAASNGWADDGSRTKSKFLTEVSHELRTPLNAIIGYSELLLETDSGLLTDRQRDFIRNIRASGAHLLEIINDVLDLSKIEAGRFDLHDDEVDVALSVAEVHALQEHALVSAELSFDAVLPRPLPRLRADRRALCQMLLNLVSNAVKYTEPGGTVVIEVARTEDGLSITVADTGIGIAEEHHAMVLEPFRQVPAGRIRNRTGTGLGLPIVRSLVEAHGGRLVLDSAPGRGTRVALHFPAERVIA
ncbi:sensor histidine kinase [Azospirillum rugosum]|uniref:histidine kinase n=1 Tax=Azospirillum rugosum TaxID=416170 RepID=A0ABS4SEE8_9PROT|nr:ATP-binding protein [Azospirillum rugosum]MBP2290877.1 signal transduction histidine kinase [Azospirillum rugosum]MDQ0529744.1 signal transduction histidine kinase [Azospirillum rugosum]